MIEGILRCCSANIDSPSSKKTYPHSLILKVYKKGEIVEALFLALLGVSKNHDPGLAYSISDGLTVAALLTFFTRFRGKLCIEKSKQERK